MKYVNCPSCKSQNRSLDKTCYNCQGPLAAQLQEPEDSGTADMTAGEALAEAGKETFTAFIALMLSTIAGGTLGFGLAYFSPNLPFFLEEVGLGALCAAFTAYAIGKFKELPEGVILARVGPAAGYGALVGFCLFGIWWSFDPSAGWIAIGAIAGFCSGLPIIVSYGLTGGESRPLGLFEFTNVLISLGVGLVLGFLFILEEGDLYWIPGIGCFLGLFPTLLGGRFNLHEFLSYFQR